MDPFSAKLDERFQNGPARSVLWGTKSPRQTAFDRATRLLRVLWPLGQERSPFFLKGLDLLTELRQTNRLFYGAARRIEIAFFEGLRAVVVELVGDKLDLFEQNLESCVDFVALHRFTSGYWLRLLCLSLLLRA